MVNSSENMNGFPSTPGEIVITGLSGRFPESNNVEEFKKQLLDSIDMVTDDPRRWPSGIHGLPEKFGKLKDLSHFDSQYFGVHAKQAEQMDPQLRILLEVTQEAILDAGYNPGELRGTKCGVFIGACASETLEYWERRPDEINGYGLTGCSRSMFANRIAYAFDFKGPSFTVDTACSSSLYAFSQAVRAIQTGDCDSAIVGGANLLLKPNACVHFQRLGMLSPDGSCKAFDCNGNGYVRSEAIAAVFLQKADVSRRIYCSVLGVKTNSDGYKDLGITYPSGEMQLQLIREVFEDTGLNPEEVVYVESHGTGTKVGDPQELYAVGEFFCRNRKEPLLVGSVKSNMGHAEGASAICSIAKVIIAMEAGIIPSNIHFSQPNRDIPSLVDGRIKVVAKNHPWKGGIVSINSFGFGGANAHLILRSNPKPKLNTTPPKLPRVIGVSGRTEEAVNELLELSSKNKDDSELLSLMYQIHRFPIAGHNFRGYIVLDDSNKNEIIPVSSERRPIWFVYPGMGSQWPAMGEDFMKIDAFRKSIERTDRVLRPRGIDIKEIIVNGTEETYDSVVNTYVAITAIQIALTDMLKMLKIEPDGLVGHSFGEVACAYADGCLTAEQAILCNLERGIAMIKSKSPPGAMASVGLSWKEAKERCPPLVYPACHNGDNNVTVSGDLKEMKKFMTTLESEDVFVREVNSVGFAFHCRHISKAAQFLQESLKNVIPSPKRRSSRWVSTSVPESLWDQPESKLCSPEYYVNNLLSPVLFQEAIKHVPNNALVIEIAPTGLFQNILKKSIGSECSTVSLAKRGHNDNVNFFLSAVGKIYASGAHPCFDSLYGKPSFPVGRGTPMISPHIKWDHSTEWTVASFVEEEGSSGETLVEIDLSKEENQYLLDHKIDGRILYPGAGYLTLIWKTLARLKNQEYEKTPVIFEDVYLHRATILSKEETFKFYINIFKETGAFELREGGSLVVSGKVRIPEDKEKENVDLSKFNLVVNKKDSTLLSDDIYKELLLRGYEYSNKFKGILECDNEANQGMILWQDNWTCFIDTIFQFTVISKNTKNLVIPTKLQRISIDPVALTKSMRSTENDDIPVQYYKDLNVVRCGGVEVRGMRASIVPRRIDNKHPKLEKYQFVPYLNDIKLGKNEILTIIAQIILENISGEKKLKMNEVILDDSVASSLSPALKMILESEPLVYLQASVVTTIPIEDKILDENQIRNSRSLEENLHFVVCHNLLSLNDLETLKIVSKSVQKHGFILLEESELNLDTDVSSLGLQIISKQETTEKVYLLLKKQQQEYSDHIFIKITNSEYSWVETLKKALRKSEEMGTKIYLYSDDKINGIVGLVNTLRKETNGQYVRYIFVQDKLSKPFSIDDYSEQLKKGLVHNVFKGGVWGCYRHLLFEDIEKTTVSHAIINTLTRGDLSSLRWIQSPLCHFRSNSSNQQLCHVYFSSLNFRDIMLASGKLPPDALPYHLAGLDNILGLEFSGRDSKGERVMGMVESRSLGTTVLIDPLFCWKVPKKWGLEEAATIPIAYSTAYYSLIIRGGLKPGESVLIHAGSGGVGIASITIALDMGCTVFTTVGSQPKRDFLKKTFPQLSDKHIGYSRDTSFEQLILSETKGKGVDVVLNSLAGEQLYASVRCLGYNGRFLEIGKVDLSSDSPLGMNIFLKNVAFHGILVDALFSSENTDAKTELVKLLSDGIENGVVKPLPATIFSEEQVEEAFRYMATGKHIGKVIIKIREEESQSVIVPKPKLVSAIPHSYMHPHKSYILVGGLGGFGLQLAEWLINRGATKIIFSSRSGIKTGYQSFCVRKWRQRGVKVTISTEDVTTEIGARRLIEHAKFFGPVGGIFNLAGVLEDCQIKNQDELKFKTCCLPKVDATMHLDKISRESLTDLDYFVTFSSVASGRGNIGQSNYSFANSVMERICEERHEAGYPGLAIQWGAVGDVGMAMELLGSNDIEIAGTLPQRISSCLSTLDVFLEQKHPIVSSFVLAESQRSGNINNRVQLVEAVANILGMKNSNSFPKNITLAELGMDSLMLAEIKHTMERNFDIILNSAEIRALTFKTLIEYEGNVKSLEEKSSSGKQHLVMKNIEVIPKETLVEMTKGETYKKTPLFLIHPMEGNIDSLMSMASQIKAPVYGLQCTADAPLESIESLAIFYLESIRKVQPSGPYVTVGYSYGASIAFEIGIQLENDGQEVELWLIDGSPQFVSQHLLRERSYKSITANTDEDQIEALIFFMRQITKVDEEKITSKLMKLSSWEKRLSATVKTLSEITKLSEEELALAATSFFYKIQAADKYKPTKKFKGKIHLVKAKENSIKLDSDYGLSKICEGRVKIDTLEGNHTSILIGPSAERLAKMLQPLR